MRMALKNNRKIYSLFCPSPCGLECDHFLKVVEGLNRVLDWELILRYTLPVCPIHCSDHQVIITNNFRCVNTLSIIRYAERSTLNNFALIFQIATESAFESSGILVDRADTHGCIGDQPLEAVERAGIDV